MSVVVIILRPAQLLRVGVALLRVGVALLRVALLFFASALLFFALVSLIQRAPLSFFAQNLLLRECLS